MDAREDPHGGAKTGRGVSPQFARVVTGKTEVKRIDRTAQWEMSPLRSGISRSIRAIGFGLNGRDALGHA